MRLLKISKTALGLLVLLLLVAATAAAFTPDKSLILSAPLRFDYVPGGQGEKPLLASDLDGAYIQSVTRSGQTVTFALQDASNNRQTFRFDLSASGSTLTAASYAADTETLTLTRSAGDPVIADLSGVATAAELSAAITAAETSVLAGAASARDAAITTAKTEVLAGAATARDAAIAAAETSVLADAATARDSAIAAAVPPANRHLPNPTLGAAGQVPTVNAAGDDYELSTINRVTANPSGSSLPELGTIGIGGTAYQIPLAFTAPTFQTDARATAAPNFCPTFTGSTLAIPTTDWFIINAHYENSGAYYVTSVFIPKSMIDAIPAFSSNSSIVTGGSNRNVVTLPLGANRGLHIGKQSNGTFRWSTTHPATSCSLSVASP